MNDRPTAKELVSAARLFLESELIPTLCDARLRFQTLITANVLAIVERELQTEEAQLLAEWNCLTAVLDLPEPPPNRLQEFREALCRANETLCERIRRGDFDESSQFATLSSQLRLAVERKLEVSNPRYLSNFRESSSVVSKASNSRT